MTLSSNPYQTLEISPNASQGEVKQAYRKLAKKFHPDCQESTANHHKIVELNAAYEILSDPQRRSEYDQQRLSDSPTNKRQQRTAQAQQYYNRRRSAETASQKYGEQWFQGTYLPLNHAFNQILDPLPYQIDDLAADPFDDELMGNFQTYLTNCRSYLDYALHLFMSQQNPPKYAKVAAALYYCLNHLGDGLDELETFTLNYDDHYLHIGQELFRRAQQIQDEAKFILAQIR
ncbi:MAG: DnaJ domain-containing protein [Microcystaceae cyanobacterium]